MRAARRALARLGELGRWLLRRPLPRPVQGPPMAAVSSWGDAREYLTTWWAEHLWVQSEIPTGHTWQHMIRWAEAEGHPIRYAGRWQLGKLAVTDAETLATVEAWCRRQLAHPDTSDTYVSVACSDGGHWDEDPGTGEHATWTPSDRVAVLAGEMAAALAPARVVASHYGPSGAAPLLGHHPDTIVVVQKAYLELHAGLSVPDAVEEHHEAGAETVHYSVGWTDWAWAGPSSSILTRDEQLAEVLGWPRYTAPGVPDGIHGAVWCEWAALRPYLAGMAAGLRALSLGRKVTAETLREGRRAYVERIYGAASGPVWDWLEAVAVPGVERVELWSHLDRAWDAAGGHPGIGEELLYLTQATRWTEAWDDWHTLGTEESHTEAVRWLYACPRAVSILVLAPRLGVKQGHPPDGVEPVPWAHDPAAMRDLVRDRLHALEST